MLALVDSRVTHNALHPSPAYPFKRGRLFTTEPATLSASAIAHDVPDQCFGC